jgi:3-hydroxybutyryl-CoA dehydrogenase
MPPMATIRTVGVLGCGLMGSGIAQVSAAAGYQTVVREVDDHLLQQGLSRIRKFLDDSVTRGKIAAESRDATLANLIGTTTLGAFSDCDLVIEAIVENVEAKQAAYTALETVVPGHTILLSNTSSICITQLASMTKRPDRFAGLHFFNPVPLMKLVEVIRALTTSDETSRTVFEFVKSIGKEGIAAPDRPGFIVNRLLVPYLLDAIRAHENGLGSVEDIDKGMTLGCGHPIGPFALLDFIGLDTAYFVASIMFDEFREPAYAPPPLLKRLVLAGRLGRKSGRGFYSYLA